MLYVTTDQIEAPAPATDPADEPIPTDCGRLAALDDTTYTACGLRLCDECASEHRCPPCDADARAAGDD
jgi:hypothetical protein